jgi:hypothetical protein
LPSADVSDAGVQPASAVMTEAAASASARPSGAPVGNRAAAAMLRRFFPADGVGGTRAFTVERDGLVEASLRNDGAETAVLAIVDAQRQFFLLTKFDDAKDKLEGFPLLKLTETSSGLLVKERYVVKVTSKTLDHEARQGLLKVFDLKGLDAL